MGRDRATLAAPRRQRYAAAYADASPNAGGRAYGRATPNQRHTRHTRIRRSNRCCYRRVGDPAAGRSCRCDWRSAARRADPAANRNAAADTNQPGHRYHHGHGHQPAHSHCNPPANQHTTRHAYSKGIKRHQSSDSCRHCGAANRLCRRHKYAIAHQQRFILKPKTANQDAHAASNQHARAEPNQHARAEPNQRTGAKSN
jgi:hypothetical protein